MSWLTLRAMGIYRYTRHMPKTSQYTDNLENCDWFLFTPICIICIPAHANICVNSIRRDTYLVHQCTYGKPRRKHAISKGLLKIANTNMKLNTLQKCIHAEWTHIRTHLIYKNTYKQRKHIYRHTLSKCIEEHSNIYRHILTFTNIYTHMYKCA